MYVQGNTVLVVDDDEINLMVAQTVPESKLSYHVLTAMNGMDGLRILKRQQVSAVLLDIEMPHMDGFETLRHIRADMRMRDIPVIMLTAAADKETVIKVAEQGVTSYIKKPFLPEDLIG